MGIAFEESRWGGAAEASTASRVGEAGTIMGETGRAGTSRGGGLLGRTTGGAGRIGTGRGQRHGVALGRRQRRSAGNTVPPEFAGGRVQPGRRTTAVGRCQAGLETAFRRPAILRGERHEST